MKSLYSALSLASKQVVICKMFYNFKRRGLTVNKEKTSEPEDLNGLNFKVYISCSVFPLNKWAVI